MLDRKLFALRNEERLSSYQRHLKDLEEKLDRIMIVHVAQRLGDTGEELNHRLDDKGNHNSRSTTEEIENVENDSSIIESKTQSSPSATIQPITPPPPVNMFTGREDYLKSIEDCFGLPKTSVEMGVQRRFVLYGMGGIGKTQIALKFLDRNRGR